jgi:hypothetical protein
VRLSKIVGSGRTSLGRSADRPAVCPRHGSDETRRQPYASLDRRDAPFRSVQRHHASLKPRTWGPEHQTADGLVGCFGCRQRPVVCRSRSLSGVVAGLHRLLAQALKHWFARIEAIAAAAGIAVQPIIVGVLWWAGKP